jgi:hypothetical protein
VPGVDYIHCTAGIASRDISANQIAATLDPIEKAMCSPATLAMAFMIRTRMIVGPD